VFDELDGALPKTCERLIELVLVEDELGLWAVDALYSIAFNSMQVSLATHVSHGRILYHLMTAFRHYFRQYIANTPEDIRTNEREAFRHGRTDDNHPRHMADRIAAILQRVCIHPFSILPRHLPPDFVSHLACCIPRDKRFTYAIRSRVTCDGPKCWLCPSPPPGVGKFVAAGRV
jgi:hypothetical protein